MVNIEAYTLLATDQQSLNYPPDIRQDTPKRRGNLIRELHSGDYRQCPSGAGNAFLHSITGIRVADDGPVYAFHRIGLFPHVLVAFGGTFIAGGGRVIRLAHFFWGKSVFNVMFNFSRQPSFP